MTTSPGGPSGPGAPGGARARARALLVDALAVFAGGPVEPMLRGELERLDGPLRVALAGRVKAGKSTLLNALAGEQVAATDATECTRVVTSYAAGPREAAWAYLRDGSVVETRLLRAARGPRVDLGAAADDVEALRIELPNGRLHELTLIDTPGIASLSTELSARAESFLAAGARRGAAGRGRTGSPHPPAPAGDPASHLDEAGEPFGAEEALGGADAVIYLLRFLHQADVGFLESFRRTGLGAATPAHALGVLSRADELAPGRADSVDVARRAAAGLGRDDRVRALVQTVVPVSGLLAQAGTRLAADELRALLALAAQPVADTDLLLLSADRFASVRGSGPPAALPEALRTSLLDRLGVAGIRLAVGLVRLGQASDPASLADALAARGGLPELRTLLRDQFTGRADALKAQRALRVLDGVLDADPRPASPATGRALAELRDRRERVETSAHALAELRLLGELRTGAAELGGLGAERRDEMERLLGASGTTVHARLGVAPEASAADLRAAALRALDTYRRLSENRLAPRSTRRAAAALRRTCEGLLGTLGPER